MNNFVDSINSTSVSKEISSFMEHKIVKICLFVFLTLYAWLIVPILPKSAIKIFDNTLFRLLVFFIIAYYASNGDVAVSILIALCFVLSLIVLTKNETDQSLLNLLNIHKNKFNIKQDINNNMTGNIKKNTTVENINKNNIINDKYILLNEGFDNEKNIESFNGPEFSIY